MGSSGKPVRAGRGGRLPGSEYAEVIVSGLRLQRGSDFCRPLDWQVRANVALLPNGWELLALPISRLGRAVSEGATATGLGDAALLAAGQSAGPLGDGLPARRQASIQD